MIYALTQKKYKIYKLYNAKQFFFKNITKNLEPNFKSFKIQTFTDWKKKNKTKQKKKKP